MVNSTSSGSHASFSGSFHDNDLNSIGFPEALPEPVRETSTHAPGYWEAFCNAVSYGKVSVVSYCTDKLVHSQLARDTIKARLLNGVDLDQWIESDKEEFRNLLPYNENGPDYNAEALPFLIEKMTPKLAEMICNAFTKDSPELKEFFENEKAFIGKITRAMLIRMLRNAVEYDKNETRGGNRIHSKDPLVRIMMRLGKFVIPAFNQVNSVEFEKSYNDRNPECKLNKEQEVFAEVSKELMAILMPNGKDDIPLPGRVLPTDRFQNEKSWTSIVSIVIPKVLGDIYHFSKGDAYQTSADKEVLERQGGAFMKALSKTIAKKVVREHAMPIMRDNKEKIGAAIVNALEKIVQEHVMPMRDNKEEVDAAIPKELHLGKEEQELIQQWGTNFVEALADYKSDDMTVFFGYAERHIESIALHMIATLAKDGEGNLVPIVAEKVVNLLYDYFILHKNFDKIKHALEAPDLSDEERAEQFKPLVDLLVKEAGLEQVVAVQILKEKELPNLVCQCFQKLAATNSEFLESKEKLAKGLIGSSLTITDEQLVQNASAENPEMLREAIGKAEEDDVIAKKTVGEIEKIVGKMADDVQKVVDRYLHNQDKDFARLINKQVLDDVLNEGEVNHFALGIVELFDQQNSAINHAKGYVRQKLYESLFKMFALMVEKMPVQGTLGEGNLRELLPGQIGVCAMRVMTNHLPTIVAEFDKIKKK